MSRIGSVAVAAIFAAGGMVSRAQDSSQAAADAVQVLAVKGVPFSAQAVTESTQMLADGNRVIRKSTSLIARDSEGRTRREQSLANGASVVLLHDPVTRTGYVLDPQSRSARKNAIPFAENAISTASPNDKSESLGTQIVEGLLAQGTRATRTIPAHEAGNDGPLEVVLETWYSAELQTVVASRYTDPRIGEITYKLTEIQSRRATLLTFPGARRV